jgi:hypothetical protein
MQSLFGMDGFINTSGDTNSPARNFYEGLKASQYLNVGSGNNQYTVLGVPVSGTIELSPSTAGIGIDHYINPWHYNYSHPTNNTGSYDLWMDVKYGGKTNRISNWSKDPQVL